MNQAQKLQLVLNHLVRSRQMRKQANSLNGMAQKLAQNPAPLADWPSDYRSKFQDLIYNLIPTEEIGPVPREVVEKMKDWPSTEFSKNLAIRDGLTQAPELGPSPVALSEPKQKFDIVDVLKKNKNSRLLNDALNPGADREVEFKKPFGAGLKQQEKAIASFMGAGSTKGLPPKRIPELEPIKNQNNLNNTVSGENSSYSTENTGPNWLQRNWKELGIGVGAAGLTSLLAYLMYNHFRGNKKKKDKKED